MTKKAAKLPDLETSLAEITTLIQEMEQGELTLEQSLSRFERGVQLIKHSQHILKEAEQKIELLMQQNGEEKILPYENPDE